MCGIAGYAGPEKACPIILEMLERLEYRGYDSAGVALFGGGEIGVYKEKGAIASLAASLSGKGLSGHVGIGHTRWATHGPATRANAHPHVSQDGGLALVHNGTVLNYYKLKETLAKAGYSFYGETDTEILVNYLDYRQKQSGASLLETISVVAPDLEGRSAFVVGGRQEPDVLYACNLGGELFIGRNRAGGTFVCSDKNALAGYADEYFSLAGGQIAVLDKEKGVRLYSLSGLKDIACPWEELKASVEALEKGSYPHFMLKEIFEQEKAVARTADSLTAGDGALIDSVLASQKPLIKDLRKLVIVACGTSWHAGLVSRNFFSELADLPVYCEYASEFLPETVGPEDLVVAISQSGSTADTLQAVRAAKERGAAILSICNVDGSALAAVSDACFLTLAGPEIGVASTKAFTTQLAVLLILAARFGRWRGRLDQEKETALFRDFKEIPGKIKEIVLDSRTVEDLAEKYQGYDDFIFLGRGRNFPIALEGALKLKEVSYIHAEGLSAGEMKHGSIALIDDRMPSFFIAVKDGQYDKVVNNLLEIGARQGRIIAITTGRDQVVADRADDIIPIPECAPIFYPFLTVIPAQLFAYYVARDRGTDIDKPRNLAKSVTVE